MEAQQTVNERIKISRIHLRLTQADISKRLNITAAQISAIESGKSNPTVPFVTKYCETYGISLNWLMTGNGEITGENQTKPKTDPFYQSLLNEISEIRRQMGDLIKSNLELSKPSGNRDLVVAL